MNYKELDDILNDDNETQFKDKVITLLEELKEDVSSSHERFWTKEVKNVPDPNDIFGLSKPVSVLQVLSFNDDLTIADRLVLTIVYSVSEITTDLLVKLTCMSPTGLRRILAKLTEQSYIIKIKNGLYKQFDKKLY